MKHTLLIIGFGLLLGTETASAAPGKIINHNHAVLNSIPLEAIAAAKDSLHIAYGHTSHGSQLLSGNGYGDFGINKLRGVSDVFVTSADGSGNTLHLREGDGYTDEANNLLVGDAGWDNKAVENHLRFVSETRKFLGTPNGKGRGSARPEYNVVMWSWCGQVSWHGDVTFDHYFTGMDSLEMEYPGVAFVWMTGHLDGTGENGQLHQRNQRIREYARTHGKWLYDFADLESYDPDGKYYVNLDANDNADTDKGNWAIKWTQAHPELVNTEINAAHSQPLVGQIKTVAAWWLFASLAGWDDSGSLGVIPAHSRQLPGTLPSGNWDLLGRSGSAVVTFER